jgi:hypothetical protein
MAKIIYLVALLLCLYGAALCDFRMYWTGLTALLLGVTLCCVAPLVADLITHE